MKKNIFIFSLLMFMFSLYFEVTIMNNMRFDKFLISNNFSFNYLLIWSCTNFQFIIPFYYLIGVFDTSKSIITKSLKDSLQIFLSFIIFAIILLFITRFRIDYDIERFIFKNLYVNKSSCLIVYYFVLGFFKFFIVPFIFILPGKLYSLYNNGIQKSIYFIIFSFLLNQIAALCINNNTLYLGFSQLMTIDSYMEANTILFIISLFILVLINILFTKFSLNFNEKIIRFVLLFMILIILFLMYYNIKKIDVENILLNGNLFILYILIIVLRLFSNDSFKKIFIRIGIYTILSIIILLFVIYNMITKKLFLKIIIIFANMFIIVITYLYFLKKLNLKNIYTILICIFSYVLYVFTFQYGEKFIIDYYFELFKESFSIHTIVHYIKWFTIFLLIYSIKKGVAYDRIKKCFQSLFTKQQNIR